MKAAITRKYGTPEVIQIMEVSKPVPGENEVLVRVHATTVNRTDCGLRAAKPFITRFFTGLVKPKHIILGSEFTGIVEAVGSSVKSLHTGDQVFGLSSKNYGAHAEYLCIDENASIATIPDNLTLDNALAICEGSWYAWNLLKEINIKKGDTILINGGSGSIGSAAVQIANSLGAEVTAVTNAQNLELVKTLGASHVVDYRKEDFTKLDVQFDYIIDAVGKTTFFKCKEILKRNGVYFSTELGSFMQNPFLAVWTSFFGSKKVLFPIPKDTKENLLFFKSLAEKGQLKPVVDRTYPFEKIKEAYEYVETGEKRGSVVLFFST
ncbi:MAG: NAD(P)-dependent alcohol dehydrogenase [Cytophagaceae bacterium]